MKAQIDKWIFCYQLFIVISQRQVRCIRQTFSVCTAVQPIKNTDAHVHQKSFRKRVEVYLVLQSSVINSIKKEAPDRISVLSKFN